MSSALSINTMFTPTPTQADDLPPFQPTGIATRNDPSSVWGFKLWLCEVQLALANLNLFAVINHGIQRPTPDHLHYENWLKWSRFISHWLLCNVGERNAAMIQSTYPGLQFADEMFYYIGCLQLTEEDAIRRTEFNKLWSMTRHQFDTLHDYISTWGAHAMFCAQFDPNFNWYAATKMILGEIKEEMPNLYNFIDHQIRTGDTSCEQFHGHLTGILDALKKRT